MDEDACSIPLAHEAEHYVDVMFSLLAEDAMITVEHIQEDMSRAYLMAAAGHAGYLVRIGDKSHDYGIDASVHEVAIEDGQREEAGFSIDVQLKATVNWTEEDDYIIYDMKACAYNKLIRRTMPREGRKQAATPAILGLLCLPKEQEAWAMFGEDMLTLQRCCFYHHLTGEPTDNTASIRVRIPKHNRLTPGALKQLFDAFYGGAA